MKYDFQHSGLPVASALPELAAALAAHRTVILSAAPGAGKTTLAPPFLLDHIRGKIVMLEPRRLAARAAADRIAALLGETPGKTVGYRIRGETCVSAATRIEVVTEGILTRMLQSDPALEGCGCVIFDEFHERNLAGDLGLAFALESAATLREDLKIVVMSATLEIDRLRNFLGGAPVIEAAGRVFPVAEHFGESFGELRNLPGRMANAVRNLLPKEPGGFLVFLPGAGEIESVARELAPHLPDDVILAPLYGSLGRREQSAAVEPPPPGRRKVVLATNIAESSLTIEGVRVVVDSGYEKALRFDPARGMPQLVTRKISLASATQRAGRAGRLEPGAVYRLWSEADHRLLPERATPEILEADLAPLRLELAQWGAQASDLRWLDPPPEAALGSASDLLRELGALDRDGHLTSFGRELGKLPAHPRVGTMLLRARDLNLLPLAAEIAALLEDRDIAPQSRSADLAERIELFRRRTGEFRQQRQIRDQLLALCHGKYTELPLDRAGLLTAFGYPDWIGRSRSNAGGDYLLECGRGAKLQDADDLRRHEFLAAARLDDGGGTARIRLAAPISMEDIQTHFPDRIETRESVEFARETRRVAARRETLLGAIVLRSAPLDNPDPALIAAALAAAARAAGIHTLGLSDGCRQFLDRLRFARRAEPERYPDWSDDAIFAMLPDLLLQFPEVRSLDALKKVDWPAALAAELGYDRKSALDRDYPERYTVPTGSKLRIDYSGDTPVLAVKVQELYGETRHPSLGHGRLPLKLELLSPAQRPIQITCDLPNFWRGNWPLVRKEMRAQYPKHLWPEAPANTPPSRKTTK